MNNVLIIAEAGVNHNGSLELAKKLIDVAVAAQVDAVKFQTFKAEKLVVKTAKKAAYQEVSTGADEGQYEMLKRLELSERDHYELQAYCKQKGILFLSTAFDLESIEFLYQLGVEIFKIPSGELTNLPYLEAIGRLKKKVVLSTGMSTLEEIEAAITILKNAGTTDLTVLHCNTEYPTPMKDVNLRAMATIREQFQVAVGYSDHTLGIEVPIAAVALGATVIEKHFTLNQHMEGPDHQASLEPDELKQMVHSIRKIEQAMGNGFKSPTESEQKNRAIARKSIVAARSIQKGDRLTGDNLTTKRPGTGISPLKWYEVVGSYATRDYAEDELIEL